MHPSTAISAPSQVAAAPSAPRAQRPNNRKSGLTAALQKQSQAQQSNSNQNRHHNNGNSPRPAQRTPEQTHHRHQSMPPQQRSHGNNSSNKVDMNNVTILKRSSAAPISKSAVAPVDIQTQGLPKQVQQPQPQHRNHYPNQKPRPQSQQQQQQSPSKARRVQRRKEAQVDLDQAMQQSPPLDPSSPPSSSDSDDSESAVIPRLPDNFLHRQLVSNPPHRPSSAPAMPQPRRGYQNMDHGSPLTGRSTQPIDMLQRPSTAAKTNSADKVILVEKKATLYAGPTFHNSPAPTSLPIPAFARSAGNSPAEPSVERLPSPPFFAEATSPRLNSMRPHAMPSHPTGWIGHQSMPMGQSYNVPERMATSSFAPYGAGQNGVDQLMEISQSLRSLLKIQSQ